MTCKNCQNKVEEDQILLAKTNNLKLSDDCACSRGNTSKNSSAGCSCCSPRPATSKSCSCCCRSCCACCTCCSGSRGDFCRERREVARNNLCANCASSNVKKEEEGKKVRQSCASCDTCIAKKEEEEIKASKSTSCSCAKCA